MRTDEFFAGFFDADGCVMIQRGGAKTSYFLLSVHIVQVDTNILHAFAERYGGSVKGPYSRGEQARPAYHWVVESAKAEAFLRRITPYLIVKRERAELALEFRTLFHGENVLPRGKLVNDLDQQLAKRARILAERGECYEQMRLLNRRGAAE